MKLKIIASLPLIFLVSCGTLRQQYYWYDFIPQKTYETKTDFLAFDAGNHNEGIAFINDDVEIKIYPRFDNFLVDREIIWAVAVRNKSESKWTISDESFKVYDSPDGENWQALMVYSGRKYALKMEKLVAASKRAELLNQGVKEANQVVLGVAGSIMNSVGGSAASTGSEILGVEKSVAEQSNEQAIANSEEFSNDANAWAQFVTGHYLYPQTLETNAAYSGVLFSTSGTFALYRIEVTLPNGRMIAFEFVQDRETGL